MPIATARKYRFGFLREVTPGVTPASPLETLRVTGGGGRTAKTTIESGEIHVGEVTDSIVTDVTNTGEVGLELSYGTLDKLLPGIVGKDWVGDVLQVGDLDISYTFEDQYLNIPKYIARAGSRIDSLALTFALGAIPTGRLTYSGNTPVPSNATIGTGTQVAAPTNRVFSPISSIRAIQEGGAVDLKAKCVSSLTLNMSRSIVQTRGLGSMDPCQTDLDIFSLTGSITFAFADTLLFEKYLNDVLTSLLLTVGGASTLKYDILLNQVQITEGGPDPVAKGQPVTQTYGFRALYDPTYTSMQITRYPAV